MVLKDKDLNTVHEHLIEQSRYIDRRSDILLNSICGGINLICFNILKDKVEYQIEPKLLFIGVIAVLTIIINFIGLKLTQTFTSKQSWLLYNIDYYREYIQKFKYTNINEEKKDLSAKAQKKRKRLIHNQRKVKDIFH